VGAQEIRPQTNRTVVLHVPMVVDGLVVEDRLKHRGLATLTVSREP
jgi:hypothetical protein